MVPPSVINKAGGDVVLSVQTPPKPRGGILIPLKTQLALSCASDALDPPRQPSQPTGRPPAIPLALEHAKAEGARPPQASPDPRGWQTSQQPATGWRWKCCPPLSP